MSAAGHLITMTHHGLAGTIGSYVYRYDNTGRRLGVVETGKTITLRRTQRRLYTYNSFDQLINATDGISQTVYGYRCSCRSRGKL